MVALSGFSRSMGSPSGMGGVGAHAQVGSGHVRTMGSGDDEEEEEDTGRKSSGVRLFVVLALHLRGRWNALRRGTADRNGRAMLSVALDLTDWNSAIRNNTEKKVIYIAQKEILDKTKQERTYGREYLRSRSRARRRRAERELRLRR